MTRKPLVLALLVATAAACSGGGGSATGPASGEAVRRQMLHRQQVKLHQRLFFVGYAAGPTLEVATQTAYGEITRQLTWLPADSRLILQGMYRVDKNVPDDAGQVHVLAVLEREAAAAHLNKLAGEQLAALRVALDKCEGLVKDGDIPRAKSCVPQEVDPLVQKVRTLYAAARAAVDDQRRPAPLAEETRAAELARRIGAGEVASRSVLVCVVSVVDGKEQGTLDAEFSKSVASAGLKLASGNVLPVQVKLALQGNTGDVAKAGREAGAGYAVVGQVEAKFSSEDSGQFFAWASGRVRVIETTAGRAVADLSYDKIKGGHITRRQACEKALNNAVAKLKQDLQFKLAGLRR